MGNEEESFDMLSVSFSESVSVVTRGQAGAYSRLSFTGLSSLSYAK